MSASARIVLIVSGGVAAYKSMELIRLLRQQGISVRCVLTRAGSEFVTPLSLSALSEEPVYSDLFSLIDEAEMGHIQLSRQADLIVVAPASANILAKMANGLADDLATTVLLATDKPVMVAPAMNVRMWHHPATHSNIETLKKRGVMLVGPDEGAMACGEYGLGRMAAPEAIAEAITDAISEGVPGAIADTGPACADIISTSKGPLLAGRSALVTSGPTYEAIDPVRYIANRSSGKQGHAIAAALCALGAKVTLVSGPTRLPDPHGVTTVHVESAEQMLEACRNNLPADLAIFAAAVADWRVAGRADIKIKKQDAAPPPALELIENPDILKTVSSLQERRPRLVIGFAAETGDLIEKAYEKRRRKGCDWIIANDVSEESGTFGGDLNSVHVIDEKGIEAWPRLSKTQVAERLAERIAAHFADITE